jgi:hypothetical protein
MILQSSLKDVEHWLKIKTNFLNLQELNEIDSSNERLYSDKACEKSWSKNWSFTPHNYSLRKTSLRLTNYKEK